MRIIAQLEKFNPALPDIIVVLLLLMLAWLGYFIARRILKRCVTIYR